MTAMGTMSTIQDKNKLVQYTTEINREYMRENAFSPYMSDEANAIIRRRFELKQGGEQVNFPLVAGLDNAGVSTDTLTGAEDVIDNYGMRVWVDWLRNAVATNNAEEQKDSADIFGEAKPLLSDWGNAKIRDETLEAMMALPSESQPTGLGGLAGNRVNGIKYEAASAAERNTFNAHNIDRVLFGNALGNYSATHATALGLVTAAAGTFNLSSIRLLKRIAKTANPHIRPYRINDGREYYVAFAGTNNFYQLKAAMDAAGISTNARPRESAGPYGAPNTPLFQDGDELYNGVIIHEIPEIDTMVNTKWTTLGTAGDAGTTRVAPVFLCGQQALSIAWAKMATPTFREVTDYQFVRGVGVKMCYGAAKMFKKHTRTVSPAVTDGLMQWGMVTGFFSSVNPT